MALHEFTAPTPLAFEELVERAAHLAASDEELMSALIEARRSAGMSQRQVAEALGIKQPTVARFERHDSDPQLSTIRRYALAVGAHVRHEVIPAERAFDPLVAWEHAIRVSGTVSSVAGIAGPAIVNGAGDEGAHYITVTKQDQGLAA